MPFTHFMLETTHSTFRDARTNSAPYIEFLYFCFYYSHCDTSNLNQEVQNLSEIGDSFPFTAVLFEDALVT